MTDDTAKPATPPTTTRARRAPRKTAVAPEDAPFVAKVDTDEFDSQLMRQQELVRERIAASAARTVVPHPSVADREKTGRIARAHITREELGEWSPAPDRADPVDLLVGQETSRVQELIPVRHARMATSAFAFYRGAALVMAADLAPGLRSGLNAQLCGDAHLSNFGIFGAPDRSLVFDVNDFDETNPGPFEWDVKRLAASFLLAGRDNGMPDKHSVAAAGAAAAAYRESMLTFAGMREADIWYARVDVSAIEAAARTLGNAKQQKSAAKSVEGAVAKARTRDAWSAIQKLTEVVDGKRQFLNQPPLLARLAVSADAYDIVNALFREYRATLQDDRQELLKRYQIIDMGHKVVGVGSVGLLAFVLLMRGRDDNDLMVLQVKQAQASVLEAYTRKSPYSKHGHRVVTGQRLMQAASDAFLGWIEGPMGRSFYVRQLRDMKWSPDPAVLTGDRLTRYAVLCGHTLARAHARSGDAVAIGAYLGNGRAFEKSMAAFSLAYADQVALDFEAFKQAIADGRIEAHEDASGVESVKASAAVSGSGKSGRRGGGKAKGPEGVSADSVSAAAAEETQELEEAAFGAGAGQAAPAAPAKGGQGKGRKPAKATKAAKAAKPGRAAKPAKAAASASGGAASPLAASMATLTGSGKAVAGSVTARRAASAGAGSGAAKAPSSNAHATGTRRTRSAGAATASVKAAAAQAAAAQAPDGASSAGAETAGDPATAAE